MLPTLKSSLLRLAAAWVVLCSGLGRQVVHCCYGDKLQSVRDAVRNGSTDVSKDRDEKNRRHSRRSDFDDEDEPSLFEAAVGCTVSAPWWLPRFALADDLSDATFFPRAPYEAGYDGYLVINPRDPLDADQFAVRISSEYATDFHDISRIGTRLLVDTSSRIGLDTEWNHWIEQTSAGRDSLSTGDFNLVYRFAQDELIQFRSGLGLNWLADSHESDFGVNFTYGLDLFPAEPFIVSGVVDLGSLGDAFYFHFRSTAGVIFGPAELFTGYDYQRIGPVDLHGLTAGIQLWF